MHVISSSLKNVFDKISKEHNEIEITMRKLMENSILTSTKTPLYNYINQQEELLKEYNKITAKTKNMHNIEKEFSEIERQHKALLYIQDKYQDLIEIHEKSNHDKFIITNDTTQETEIENASNLAIVNSIIPEITAHDCIEFINHLSEKPYLAYKHKIGKAIYDFISEQEKENTNAVEVYRVRINNEGKLIPYVPNQMFEPMYGTPGQSRFSPLGHNYLYLCNNLETAIKETGVTENSIYTWIKLKFKIDFKLLDITKKRIPIFDFCHKMPTDDSALKTEYLMPNYISNCARDLGFEGILYSSIHNRNAHNYVIFGAGEQNFDCIDINSVGYREK